MKSKEKILLTENDFDYIHWEKDSESSESFQLIICGQSKLHYNEIKQKILENQEILEKLQEI